MRISMLAGIVGMAMLALTPAAFAGAPVSADNDNPDIPNCVFMKHIPNCETVFLTIEDRQDYAPVFADAPAIQNNQPAAGVGLGPSGPTGMINGIDVVWSNPAVYDENGNVRPVPAPQPPRPPRTCTQVDHPTTYTYTTGGGQTCTGTGSHRVCTSNPPIVHTQTQHNWSTQCN